jgi:malate synthase
MTLYKDILMMKKIIRIWWGEHKKQQVWISYWTFNKLVISEEFEEFLTLPAYQYI